MQISYSYPSGRREVAVVLAVGCDFIRVVAPGRSDGFDLYLRDLEWVTETGTAITVDAILFEEEAALPTPFLRNVPERRKIKPSSASQSGV